MRIALCLLTALALTVGCGDDDDSPAGPTRVDVAGSLANGTDLTDIQTHWNSSGTSGPLLMVSFLEDGTGRLNFGNDALYSTHSRRLLDFTWQSTAPGRITLTIALSATEPEVLVVDLLQVDGSVDDGGMSALIETDGGDVFTLNFTLRTGPPPCC